MTALRAPLGSFRELVLARKGDGGSMSLSLSRRGERWLVCCRRLGLLGPTILCPCKKNVLTMKLKNILQHKNFHLDNNDCVRHLSYIFRHAVLSFVTNIYLNICLEAPTRLGLEDSLHASISFLRMKRHSRNVEKNG